MVNDKYGSCTTYGLSLINNMDLHHIGFPFCLEWHTGGVNHYITIYHKPFFLEFVLDIQKGFIRRAGFIIMISPYTPHKTQLGN